MAIRVDRLDEPPKTPKPPQPRFFAAEAGPDWQGHATLARACEAAVLTVFQANVLRLKTSGLNWLRISQALGVKKQPVYKAHAIAVKALARRNPGWARDLQECFENVRLQGKGQAHVTCDERRQRPALSE